MNNKVVFAFLILGTLIFSGCSSTAGPDENGRVPLGYWSARMYDFVDIFKINGSIDHGFNLYLVGSIEPFALGGGYFDGEKLGFDGRKIGRWSERRAEIGLVVESFAKYDKVPIRGNRYLFDEAFSPHRNTWDEDSDYFYDQLGMTYAYIDPENNFLDVTLECHLVNLGLDLGVSIQEALDFLVGIACVDVISDDDWENPGYKSHPWPFFPDPALEGTIAPSEPEEEAAAPAEEPAMEEPAEEPEPPAPEPAVEPAIIEEPVPEPEPETVEPEKEPIAEPPPVPEPEAMEPELEPIAEPEPLPEPETIEPEAEPAAEPAAEEPEPLPEPEALEPETEPAVEPAKEPEAEPAKKDDDTEEMVVVKEEKDSPEEAPKVIPIESKKKESPPEKFPPATAKKDEKKKKKKKKIPIWEDDILNP